MKAKAAGMGQAAAGDALEVLTRENPRGRRADLITLADNLALYVEASVNIRRFGAVTLHPKTGAPIPNPYLEVQRHAGGIMRKLSGLTIDGAIAVLEAAAAERAAAEKAAADAANKQGGQA